MYLKDISVKMRWIWLLWLVMPPAVAQESTSVHGRFESDSVSIGEEVPYTLAARYSRNQQVLFPDSSFSFAPFEFSRKKYYTTKTSGTTSYDSVVYF